MVRWEWGEIESECIKCGSKATHYIERLQSLRKYRHSYCKKCWLKKVNKIIKEAEIL